MEKELFSFYRNSLLGEVSNSPLCKEYQTEWRKCGEDKEALVKLALRRQSLPYFFTACYENLGLSPEYILDTFGDHINENRLHTNVDGIEGYSSQLFVQYDKDFTATADTTALMWCRNIKVEVPITRCPFVYVSNLSDVHISCVGYNSVYVYLFDESKVTIDGDETCEVIVYKYSDVAMVERGRDCKCEVKTFNKMLRL